MRNLQVTSIAVALVLILVEATPMKAAQPKTNVAAAQLAAQQAAQKAAVKKAAQLAAQQAAQKAAVEKAAQLAAQQAAQKAAVEKAAQLAAQQAAQKAAVEKAAQLAAQPAAHSIAAVPAGTRLTLMGQAGPPPQAAARDFIVVFHDDERDVDGLAAQHGRAYGASVSQLYHSALKGYAATIPQAQLGDIQRDPRVAFVSEDRPVEAVAQTLPTGVDRIDGELSTHFGSNSWSVKVAVIDTGSGPHSDLNIAGGKNCSTGKSFSDGNGHGTHVAGTIGAINNGYGVVGVAPGIPIYSVRVLNNAGSGTWSSVICGIDWVTANAASLNIKVANMSLGGGGSDDGNCGNTNADALHKAICGSVGAGVTYAVAAGNSNVDFAGFVPAAYNEVLTVTAMADFNGQPGGGAAATCRSDVDDTSADFSNFTVPGSSDEGHTIAAPGVCILSTWKGGGYNTISGTSMASPHAAGTAALCIGTGKCPGTSSDVMNKLRFDASVPPAGYGFLGAPDNLIAGRYYGYLVYAGGY